MRVGVVFPQTEIGADAGDLRTYARTVEEMGFRHVLAYDHVVGADPAVHQGWRGPYDISHTFHEPMVLFGFLAGLCSLELVTGVLVLPQRQTVLAAKQAAALDVVSEGRLRLGVGIGWNAIEYEALGQRFANRGRRIEEQIELMRKLWTEPTVSFEGVTESVRGAGLAPLPVQRPIPVWLGAFADERALRRAGRLGDGWIPLLPPGPDLERACAVVAQGATDAGRDPAQIGMEGRVEAGDGDAGRVLAEVEAWATAGATHVCLNTMRAGLEGVAAHLARLEAAATALGL